MGKSETWGSIAFKAEGLSIEKLLRLCSEKGIPLHGVRRTGVKGIAARCPLNQYEQLKAICSEKGWKLSNNGYRGCRAWWEKVKQHTGGLAAGLASVLIISAAMAFVWQIRIEGAGVYEGDLYGYLGERGIRVGTLKSKVDVKQLCRDLEWRYPQTAWVQADWRGSTLVIRLVEGVPAPQVASYGEAGDVVADRGGIILSVEPQAGTALVKPGDIVTPGQILIKGEEKRGTEETIWVKARGHVWARVWDRVAVELPMTLNLSEATGRSATVWEIDLPGKSFSFAEEPSYDLMDIHSQMVPIGGCWWPVWLKQSVYEEVTLRQELRPEEEVKAEAGLIAMRLLREKVGLGDELVDKWVDYCMIDGGKLAAYATAERRVDIADFVPYSQTPPSR